MKRHIHVLACALAWLGLMLFSFTPPPQPAAPPADRIPDFAYLAETPAGELCAVLVYFHGLIAVEDRTDCGFPAPVLALR